MTGFVIVDVSVSDENLDGSIISALSLWDELVLVIRSDTINLVALSKDQSMIPTADDVFGACLPHMREG